MHSKYHIDLLAMTGQTLKISRSINLTLKKLILNNMHNIYRNYVHTKIQNINSYMLLLIIV